MRNYHSPEPIILSVGEEDEVSIGDIARYIAGKNLSWENALDDVKMSRGHGFPWKYRL